MFIVNNQQTGVAKLLYEQLNVLEQHQELLNELVYINVKSGSKSSHRPYLPVKFRTARSNSRNVKAPGRRGGIVSGLAAEMTYFNHFLVSLLVLAAIVYLHVTSRQGY